MSSSSRPPEFTQEQFDVYNTDLQATALKATRNAAFLPADLAFYRSLDRGIAKDLDASSARVLGLANKLLDLVSTADNSKSKGKGKGRLEHDDVTDNFRSAVVDSMDQLLERADICLDEFLGLVKQPAIAMNPKPLKQKKGTTTPSGKLDPGLQHASHIPKPQLNFKRKPDNSSSTTWQPNLRHKYNAQVPLGYDMRDENGSDGSSSSLHPYRHEIKHLEYPSHMFRSAEPVPPKSFEDTPFNWVTDAASFASMLEKLRAANEIAIDLEYHSYRSFYGFVCLMQLSTREEDFVVDTLALRQELEELNEVFTNPSIVKVLHGAESDIVWLQQDFNLYIVNLFDTFHASKVLDFPRHSLATLMEMYCDFTPDKRYQLADWRIRPLPEEMLHYARSDTHFLLFIYDHLRNALLDRAQSRSQSPAIPPPSPSSSTPPAHALVREVLARSAETSLRVPEREAYDAAHGSGPGGWDTLARKWNKGGLMADARDGGARRVYRAVHAWRDRVARAEDESTRYVLPNHHLFVLAERPPADIAGLLGAFAHVPPVVRRRAKELHDAIREAAQGGEAQAQEAAPAMDVDADADAPSAEPTVTDTHATDTKLWPTGTSSPRPADPPRTFPGPNPLAASRTFAASRSALFAARAPPVSGATRSWGSCADTNQADAHRQRVRAVVAKIYGSLAIAPRAPSPSAAVPSAAAAVSVPPVQEEVQGQAAVPFVPAAARTHTAAEPDAIVVVGQAQRKKRKRVAAVKTDSAKIVAEEQEEQEGSFDYSAVGNILDEGSDHEPETTQGGRKRRQKAQGRFEYGNFRAPPKAHSEVKSGNTSRTFK